MKNKQDIKFMNYAINLAKRNIGITGKNPSVGCVIVYENTIISTGVTFQGGRPHAEKIAIDKVKNKDILKKCTLYVSLEPCISNDKSKETCCNYIVKHNIHRVVIAMKDPSRDINGSSIVKLKNHGIEVVSPVLLEQAQSVNSFFCHNQENKTPYVTLKIATSLDGKIATKTSDSKWITGEDSRKYAHFLRSQNDAILVGAKTVRIDNPQLNCRIKGLEKFSPKIFILSKNLNFDHDLQVLSQNNTDIYLISPKSSQNIEKFYYLKQHNPNINHITFEDGDDYMKKIYQIGIKSILVEGGSNLATQLIKDDRIDRLIWIRSNKIIGNDGLPAIAGLSLDKISQAINRFKTKKIKSMQSDVIQILERI